MLKGIIDLLYPPSCLHCHSGMRAGTLLLCEQCQLEMAQLDEATYCHRCLHPVDNADDCSGCRKQASPFQEMGAVFSYQGPAQSLITVLKYGQRPELAEGAGAYMAALLLQRGWPVPDLIVPVPVSWLRRLDRGYNQSALLAQTIGSVLGVPVANALARSSSGYSQAGLAMQQRHALAVEQFTVQSPKQVRGKTILVVDDVLTTGATMRCCAQALAKERPASLWGLVFCESTRHIL